MTLHSLFIRDKYRHLGIITIPGTPQRAHKLAAIVCHVISVKPMADKGLGNLRQGAEVSIVGFEGNPADLNMAPHTFN